jgi:hypothetical protein
MRPTESSSVAFAPNPYTVSVGKATKFPFIIELAASFMTEEAELEIQITKAIVALSPR